MYYEVQWSASASEDIDGLFDYFVENASISVAQEQCERLLKATDKLVAFPRLYEVAPEYGNGIRRISQQGQNILYEIDEATKIVRVLAVVGQRQKARNVR